MLCLRMPILILTNYFGLTFWASGTVFRFDSGHRFQFLVGCGRLNSDLDSRLAYPRPRPRPRLAHPRPRPRPRLGSFKTKTKTKTCLSKTKTKTKTQQFQDQDQDQDLLIQDQDRDRDSRLTRPLLAVHDWDEL